MNSKGQPSFSRILLQVGFSSLINIVLSFGFLFFSVEGNMLSLVNGFAVDSLKQVRQASVLMTESARSLGPQILYDAALAAILSQNPRTTEQLAAMIQLSNYVAVGYNLDSVYIFNSQDDLLYSTKATKAWTSTSSAEDQDVIQLLRNFREYPRLLPISRKIDGRQVYTYLIYEQDNSKKDLALAVILNYSEAGLRSTVENLNAVPDSRIFVLDQQGNIILSNGSNFPISSFASLQVYQDISAQTAETGYFVRNFENRSFLFTFARQAETGWLFVRMTPSASVERSLGLVRWMVVIFTIFSLAVGFFVANVITKRIYFPIAKIITDMQALQDVKLSLDEQSRRDYWINCLLGQTDAGPVAEGLPPSGLPPSAPGEGCLVLAVFVTDEVVNTKSQRTALGSIRDFLAAQAQGTVETITVLDLPGEQHAMVLECLHPIDLEVFVAWTRTSLQNCRERWNLSFSVALVGNWTTNEASVALSDALDTLDKRYYFGPGWVAEAGAWQEKPQVEFRYPSDLERSFLDVSLKGQLDESDRIFAAIMQKTLPYGKIVRLETLMRVVLSLGSVLPGDREFGDFILQVTNATTLVEAQRLISQRVKAIADEMGGLKAAKQERLVENVQAMILDRLADKNLSLEMIAGHLQLSPGYLGRSYKRNTSESVVGAISRYRIVKAKQLLTAGNDPVNSIAGMTGFTNSRYFFMLFKKETGLTPTEFRLASLSKGR